MDLNLLDIAILMVFAFFLLSGWYVGFMNTLFSLCSHALSVLLAFVLHPVVSNMIKGNQSLYTTALYYAEGSEFIKDIELARSNVSSIGSEQLAGAIESSNLPIPIGARISENIAKESFSKLGLSTMGEYYNQTIVNIFINILSILILFVIIRLLFAFVIHMLDYARKGFPSLQMADGLLGASFGLIRGFLCMFLIFLITPVLLIILPKLGNYLNASFFGNFFYYSNFLLRLIPG